MQNIPIIANQIVGKIPLFENLDSHAAAGQLAIQPEEEHSPGRMNTVIQWDDCSTNQKWELPEGSSHFVIGRVDRLYTIAPENFPACVTHSLL